GPNGPYPPGSSVLGHARQQAAARFVSVRTPRCYLRRSKWRPRRAPSRRLRLEGETEAMMRNFGGLRSIIGGPALALAALLALGGSASAGTGQPSPWQFNFQTPVTPIMEAINSFHIFLTIIATAITVFV